MVISLWVFGWPKPTQPVESYFFLLPFSLYVVVTLAPIAASISFTSPAWEPLGSSDRYLFNVSAVPGGASSLPDLSMVLFPIMSEPLMKYASALFGSAAIALSHAARAPWVLPVLY